MNIEALWAIQFSGTNLARAVSSGGVLVVHGGKVFGGDTWEWYTGTYDRDQKTGQITFRIKTGIHSTIGGESIFGGPLKPLKLVGNAEVSADMRKLYAKLTVEGDPRMRMDAILSRVAELP